jgi:hypothetical protein
VESAKKVVATVQLRPSQPPRRETAELPQVA